ncbi:transmembrane protein 54-like [Cololabis saira]|uniref:transmembrane protein 54-like n=1 Tax=Cololabis saira TaxID=129043 RepID=UPI002AD52B74|nr:transmembrane protein 54-like [Cololabis saira]
MDPFTTLYLDIKDGQVAVATPPPTMPPTSMFQLLIPGASCGSPVLQFGSLTTVWGKSVGSEEVEATDDAQDALESASSLQTPKPETSQQCRVCCTSLEEPGAQMKAGLSVIIIGHVNFLLGALVHGVVLRHINLHKQARAMEYAISNVIALASGMVGIVVGVLFIVLSKNKKSRCLVWSLFILSLASAVMTAASAVGLFVSLVRAIVHGGRSLLTHCRFPDAIGYSSVTNECPFDPTRIYSTTLILWVPLIVTCVIQLVFSARCFAACVSFLGLPCCPTQRSVGHQTRAVSLQTHVVLF